MNTPRGRLYVDRDVQKALVVQLVRQWAIFLAVLAGVLLAFEALMHPERSIAGHFAALWQRHAPLWLTLAALFPAFIYDSFKLSNRFCGPILRLRRVMREAAAGESVSPLHFRKNDFWRDMGESFNAIMERVEASESSPEPTTRGDWGGGPAPQLAGVSAGDSGLQPAAPR